VRWMRSRLVDVLSLEAVAERTVSSRSSTAQQDRIDRGDFGCSAGRAVPSKLREDRELARPARRGVADRSSGSIAPLSRVHDQLVRSVRCSTRGRSTAVGRGHRAELRRPDNRPMPWSLGQVAHVTRHVAAPDSTLICISSLPPEAMWPMTWSGL